jgi:hypothetical protein
MVRLDGGASLRLETAGADHLAPLLGFLRDQLAEIGRRARHGRATDGGMKAKLAAIGGDPMPGSSAEFGKLIADETEKWGKVVRTAGLKPE